jgi:hypothetical protein
MTSIDNVNSNLISKDGEIKVNDVCYANLIFENKDSKGNYIFPSAEALLNTYSISSRGTCTTLVGDIWKKWIINMYTGATTITSADGQSVANIRHNQNGNIPTVLYIKWTSVVQPSGQTPANGAYTLFSDFQ